MKRQTRTLAVPLCAAGVATALAATAVSGQYSEAIEGRPTEQATAVQPTEEQPTEEQATAVQPTEEQPTAGQYTEEQATRGQALYYAHCLSCHGEDMAGLDRAPPLAGPQFTGVWEGEPLWALAKRIDMMPPEQPGKLSREETVEILAYMLWYNGVPIGEVPLSTEQSVLADTKFHAPPLPGQ